MGKSKDKSKKRDKKDKRKKKHKKDKKRKLEHSDSESETDTKYSREDPEELYKEKAEKKRREKKEYSSSSESSVDEREKKSKKRKKKRSKKSESSSSSSESSDDEREKKSKRKSKASNHNTDLLGTTISTKDYESVRFKFKVWLERDEKTDKALQEIESKNDLLMLHFGKFIQLWNEGTLNTMYYHKEPEELVEKRADTGVKIGPAAAEKGDDNKFTMKGDNGLSDRYLTGSRDVPWIHQRVNKMRKLKEKRQNRLNAKASAYQEKEKEKMDEFKKVMGLI
eukprot:Phypoly_transcript_15076.p1 GENE.Phypoly_transcript_15076~~Phypoly_transcript_15076.p1  ORF type:complete len:281 (+),score=76.45 Phypoly_transcript_15076:96-938(+)